MDTLTMELKRGYSQHTVQDVIDRLDTAAVQPWERFFQQAIRSHEQAGSIAWFLVTRRDRRQAWVWFPHYFMRQLQDVGVVFANMPAWIRMAASIRNTDGDLEKHVIVGCSLDSWLERVSPQDIMELRKSQ